MNIIDRILTDNRRLEPGEIEYGGELEENGFCGIKEIEYFKCSHREDDDFPYVVDESCPAEIRVEESKNEYTCPYCERSIYISDKTIFTKHIVMIDKNSILNYFEHLCEQVGVDDIDKRYSGRMYHQYRLKPLVDVAFSDITIRVPLLSDVVDESVCEWICIYSNNTLTLLTGDSTFLTSRMDELNLPYLSFGELYQTGSDQAIDVIESKFRRIQERDEFWNLEHKTVQSHRYSEGESKLKKLTPTDFEYIVHNYLLFVLGSSHLFGATEPGSGYPDGVFTIYQTEDVFLWDAKFVNNYSVGDETSLSGEYDKIYRHLRQLRTTSQVNTKFGDVSGIVLFSPRIKPANIHRLAEFIQEQQAPGSRRWNGWVISFDFDALQQLYRFFRDNKYDVLQKPDSYQNGVQNLLTSSDKHVGDPSPIAGSDYNCLHVSSDDIRNLFSTNLQYQEKERIEFNREAYTADIEWNY